MVTNRSLGLCEVIRKEVFQYVLINPTRIYLSILNLHRGGESQFYIKLRLLYEVFTSSRLTEKIKKDLFCFNIFLKIQGLFKKTLSF